MRRAAPTPRSRPPARGESSAEIAQLNSCPAQNKLKTNTSAPAIGLWMWPIRNRRDRSMIATMPGIFKPRLAIMKLLHLSITGATILMCACTSNQELSPMTPTSLSGLGAASRLERGTDFRPNDTEPLRLAGVGKVAGTPAPLTTSIATRRKAFSEPSEVVGLPLDTQICAGRTCTHDVIEERVRTFLRSRGHDDIVFGTDGRNWWTTTRRERITSDYKPFSGPCRYADDQRASCLSDWSLTIVQKCYFTRYIVIDISLSSEPTRTSRKNGLTYDELRDGTRRLPDNLKNREIDPTRHDVTWLQYYEQHCSNTPSIVLKPETKTLDKSDMYGLGAARASP